MRTKDSVHLGLSRIQLYNNRAVNKSRGGGGGGAGIFPTYYEYGPQLLSLEDRRKIEPKEIPSCLIRYLLVVSTWQLEILVTTLY